MITYKKQTIEQEIPDKLVCDKCKKEFDCDNESGDYIEIQEFHHINFIAGYGSVFGDGWKIRMDICQRCLYEMIKDFVKYENF